MIVRGIHSVFILAIFCFSIVTFSQEIDEGMTLLKDSDDNRIKFENHFYEALKYKAIGNYSRAIVELENCQQLFPEEHSLAFEFSKNYFALGQLEEGVLYIEKALQNDPDNYWYLEHAKTIYIKQYNYNKAISAQEQIVLLRPEKKVDLVRLFIRASELDKASLLLDELKSQGVTSTRLQNYQKMIVRLSSKPNSKEVVESKTETIEELKEKFKADKQFDVLKKILEFELSNLNEKELIKYCEEGLELFPAQPFVYLMQGRSFNFGEKYNDAIDVLMSGIDFIVDDKLMESNFYEQLAISYDGLNQIDKAKKSREKSVELRKELNK